jgi:hypothetical protein
MINEIVQYILAPVYKKVGVSLALGPSLFFSFPLGHQKQTS